MAKKFVDLDTHPEDEDQWYGDAVLVDSCGADIYYGRDIEMSLSFMDLDNFELAYHIIGADPDEGPEPNTFSRELYADWVRPDELTDAELEHIAHVALRILSERKCGQ